jgi:hypothetical protein
MCGILCTSAAVVRSRAGSVNCVWRHLADVRYKLFCETTSLPAISLSASRSNLVM